MYLQALRHAPLHTPTSIFSNTPLTVIEYGLPFLQATIEQLKEQLEDGRETAADIQRQLTKAVGEAASLRQKADMAEEGIKPEEMEDLKRKMGVRLQDSESQLEAALTKAVNMEKAKNRLQVELDTLAEDLEKVRPQSSRA